MPDVDIRGAERLALLSRQIKDLGDKDLKRELTRAIERTVEPLRRELPLSALRTLPQRGGLAARVASSQISIDRRSTGRGSGLRVRARNPYALRRIDKGIIRHPVYGNRRAWVKQRVEPGWFTNPIDAAVPAIRADIEKVMNALAARIGS